MTVCTVFEFRTTQGLHHREQGPHVQCTGAADVRALEASFLAALQQQAARVQALHELAEEHRAPHHD